LSSNSYTNIITRLSFCEQTNHNKIMEELTEWLELLSWIFILSWFD